MKSDLKFPDRYVNNMVFQSLAWPQYDSGCALASFTTVVNYLFAKHIGVQSQEDIVRTLSEVRKRQDANNCARGTLINKDFYGRKSPPNAQGMFKWFMEFLRYRDLKGTCGLLFELSDIKRNNSNTEAWDRVKDLIAREDSIVVYAERTHYSVACGYSESADEESPESAYSPLSESSSERSIIIANPSPGNWAPLYSRRWKTICRELLNTDIDGGEQPDDLILFQSR